MKSHTYPQALIKLWAKSIYKSSKNSSFYIINLNNKNNYQKIDIISITTIDNIINSNKICYYDFQDKLIQEYENKWNNEIEQPFLTRVYYSITKIINKHCFLGEFKNSKSKNSFYKEINYLLKIKRNIIEKFLLLSVMRSSFNHGFTKMIDQNQNISYGDLSTFLTSRVIQNSKEDFDMELEKLSEMLNLVNYDIFVYPVKSYVLVDPIIINYNRNLFAVPIGEVGFLIFIKKEFRILCKKDDKGLFFEFISTNFIDKNLINKHFIFLDKSVYNEHYNDVKQWFLRYMIHWWFRHIGYKKGKLYIIAPQEIYDNIWSSINENNYFDLREKYIYDETSYDENNTIFVFNEYK